MELPKLTSQQQKFVLRYIANGNNASEAYRYAYNCENMSEESVNVEASRQLKNPKIAPWIEFAKKNAEEVFKKELNYSVKDCFNELNDLKTTALTAFDKNGNPNVNAAIKTVELKGKLAGFFVDRHQMNGTLADFLEQLQ